METEPITPGDGPPGWLRYSLRAWLLFALLVAAFVGAWASQQQKLNRLRLEAEREGQQAEQPTHQTNMQRDLVTAARNEAEAAREVAEEARNQESSTAQSPVNNPADQRASPSSLKLRPDPVEEFRRLKANSLGRLLHDIHDIEERLRRRTFPPDKW